ncbi:hypothetical protein DFH07DRAFT_730956 [Mycena maculata]|uniref:Reverse transcriptase zinc-binding domain-containing protein n=1 Tax=Mycena maculata TaxID=230809 RepID=A0AAD7K8R1_9AGAR|nr:hypothetical protein DFH07DRAFT_730956 [Mycena maculata]
MFSCPGILISQGSQRVFTKIIKGRRSKPFRKITFINLDRIRCSVQEVSDYIPTDEMIWKSIRSTNLRRLHRELFWRSIHNTFRVGDFWTHIDNLEPTAACPTCSVPESLEHIAMECDASGAKLIWKLTEELWAMKYSNWPTLNWGLILGCCGLAEFRDEKGKTKEGSRRLYRIIVSESAYTIWKLRNDRRISRGGAPASDEEIMNKWKYTINQRLQVDITLANRPLKGKRPALAPQLVITTWSGTLDNERNLPANWLREPRVLVGNRAFPQTPLRR